MATYVPKSGDIFWLDMEPARSKEIGKYRPALALSDITHQKKTGCVIFCPISTLIRGSEAEVPIKNLNKPSVIVSNFVQTLSWKTRQAKFITQAEQSSYEQTLLNIVKFIKADKVIKQKLFGT